MLSSLIESLKLVPAGDHLSAAGGGLIAMGAFVVLLLLCRTGKKEDKK